MKPLNDAGVPKPPADPPPPPPPPPPLPEETPPGVPIIPPVEPPIEPPVETPPDEEPPETPNVPPIKPPSEPPPIVAMAPRRVLRPYRAYGSRLASGTHHGRIAVGRAFAELVPACVERL